MAKTLIPRPPRPQANGERDQFELTKWFDTIWLALGNVSSLSWTVINFTGSELTDIETRKHADLQSILQADDTSTTTTGEKHVTNAQVKKYEDHRQASTNVHGIGSGSSVVGTTTTQTLTNKKFGGSSDYAEFEADGTLKFTGDATIFEDMQGSALNLKVLGSGITESVTENTVSFLTSADLSDYIYGNYQISHAWRVGSDVFLHIHWEQAQNNIPNFLFQYRWQAQGAAKTTAWANLVCLTPAFTYSTGTLNQINLCAAITPPAGAGISDIVEVRLYRDNANDSTEFAGADPYTTTVGVTFIDIHVEKDTLGSREEYTK